MGMFDTVHTGDRCGQTKALGKSLADLVPGDAAHVVPAAMTEAEHRAELEGRIGPVADSANVQVGRRGSWLVIRDGVIERWDDVGDDGLPYFDYFGHPTRRPDRLEVARQQRESDDSGECEMCAAVRAGRVDDLRAERRRSRLRSV